MPGLGQIRLLPLSVAARAGATAAAACCHIFQLLVLNLSTNDVDGHVLVGVSKTFNNWEPETLISLNKFNRFNSAVETGLGQIRLLPLSGLPELGPFRCCQG